MHVENLGFRLTRHGFLTSIDEQGSFNSTFNTESVTEKSLSSLQVVLNDNSGSFHLTEYPNNCSTCVMYALSSSDKEAAINKAKAIATEAGYTALQYSTTTEYSHVISALMKCGFKELTNAGVVNKRTKNDIVFYQCTL